MDIASHARLLENPQMLPPSPGTFVDREELIQYVGNFASSQGYIVVIKSSKKERRVTLGCDRGGVYRPIQDNVDDSSGEHSNKKKRVSKRTNCPFQCFGENFNGLWKLMVENGTHNHEPLKDLSKHPAARRFTETEEIMIKEMVDAGLKPRQILKRLKKKNPDLLSTSKDVYNLISKIKCGKFTGQGNSGTYLAIYTLILLCNYICLVHLDTDHGNNKKAKKFNPLRPSSLHKPTTSEPSWRQRDPPRYPNLIGGKFVESQSSSSIDVINPATQKVVSQVPLTTHEEFKAAVFAAKRAFPLWRKTPVPNRRQIIFKFQELIRREIDKLALNITTEHGKPLKDAYDEVSRGLEVVEDACGTTNLKMGKFASDVSHGTDSYSIREPLGVCAGICSFNFPAMLPLWMFLVAVTCGNTIILKPSEKVPGASITIAELVSEAGFPNGVLNIIHGADDIINSLCNDEDIHVITFVGWDSATKYIYGRASASCNPVQSNTRAKNYAIVMPDAAVDNTLDALVATGFGAAGQNFMVISAVIFVGGLDLWKDKLVERAKLLKVNAGSESDADVGPLITRQAKEHTCRLIQRFINSGANLVFDGREILVHSYESGNFVGPTILSDIRDDMECFREEIFGPVLLCLEADTLEAAINIVNRSNYGTRASIFTDSGSAARTFQTEIDAGLIGINVPVAAQLPVLSFTGNKASFSGDLHFHAEAGVQFYSRVKTVTRQWKDFRSSCRFSSSDREPMVIGEFSRNGNEPWGNIDDVVNIESLAFSSSDGSQEMEDA